MKNFFSVFAATLFVQTALAPMASAGEVDDILAIADANLTKVKDLTYDAELEVVRDNKTIKTIKFIAKLKGLHMKIVKFTAPGDVRGMSILTTVDDLMYVYMPSYKRVRRVAAHVRNQGFMGTDISAEEMGSASLSTGWHAKVLKQDDSDWVLEMTPKKGTETLYSKMKVTVSKIHKGVTRVESFDGRGKLVKSQVRSEWKDFGGGITMPSLFTYKDHRTGSQTLMRFNSCKVNQGIPDSAFTKRALLRSN